MKNNKVKWVYILGGIFVLLGVVLMGINYKQRQEPAYVFKNITAAEAKKMIEEANLPSDKLVLLDVRTIQEFQEGHIEGAINMSVDMMETSMEQFNHLKDVPKIIYCRSGRRSLVAADLMKEHGHQRIMNMEGGIIAWRELEE